VDETDNAAQLFQSAAEINPKSDWICLKNVHLVSSWLTTLDRLLDEIQVEGGKVDDNFRLWMTSEPVETLPAALLQRSKKVVSEVNCQFLNLLNLRFNLNFFPKMIGSARNETQLEPDVRLVDGERH
jgi:Dynein heavy chain region D6 P-loop domain